MPVQKFHSIEEMNARAAEPQASLAERIAYVWSLALTMGKPLPRGLFKFRSVEEMNAAREGGR